MKDCLAVRGVGFTPPCKFPPGDLSIVPSERICGDLCEKILYDTCGDQERDREAGFTQIFPDSHRFLRFKVVAFSQGRSAVARKALHLL